MFPGGGFLAHAELQTWHGAAHIAVAAAAFALFVGALSLWFATGNVIAPPLVWLLAAIAAASMDHGELEPHAVRGRGMHGRCRGRSVLLVACGQEARVAGFRRRDANDYLKAAGRATAASARSEGVDAGRRGVHACPSCG